VQALIRYRNGLAHGFNMSVERASADLATYTPVLTEILREARFMTRYPLFAVRGAQPGRVLAQRLMGHDPSPALEEVALDNPSASPLFLFAESSRATLPLTVFLDRLGDDDVGLFEGVTRTTVVYVSPRGGVVEKQSAMEAYRKLLGAKSAAPPLLDAAGVSLDVLRAAAARVTAATIDALIASGKYLRVVTRPRRDFDQRCEQLERGDHRAMVLGGESGIGKSTLLARFAEDRAARGDVVLFYRAAALFDDDLGARVTRDLGAPESRFEDLLAMASAVFASSSLRYASIADCFSTTPPRGDT
jgi:hypothetical protein